MRDREKETERKRQGKRARETERKRQRKKQRNSQRERQREPERKRERESCLISHCSLTSEATTTLRIQ